MLHPAQGLRTNTRVRDIMAKSSRRKKKQNTQRRAAPETHPTRRATLLLVSAGIVGAIGLFSVNAVQATVAEHDLSRIGNGTPAVVQIHDPQCTLCTQLQRETRKALRALPDGAITYLIANIRNTEGAAFANRHGQPHVTLLLFDGQGKVYSVINGVTDSAELEEAFQRHLTRTQPRG